jgi:hypothetical protein
VTASNTAARRERLRHPKRSSASASRGSGHRTRQVGTFQEAAEERVEVQGHRFFNNLDILLRAVM